jgi:hypothetical protein
LRGKQFCGKTLDRRLPGFAQRSIEAFLREANPISSLACSEKKGRPWLPGLMVYRSARTAGK